MSVNQRRTLYGVLAALGLAMMLPLLIHAARLQAELASADVGALTDPALIESLARPVVLFLLGMCVAAGFLYAALSAGYPRAWRPRRNGVVRCGRCGGAVDAGAASCPSCGQHLVW